MKTFNIALVTAALLSAQCTSQKTTSVDNTSEKQATTEYTLSRGEQTTVDKNIIEFVGIIEDSRCPEGVNCIWAGVAVGEFKIMGPATRPVTFHLASMDFPSRNHYKSYVFNGQKITLTHVNSLKKTQGRTKDGGDEDFKVKIKVEKATPEEIANPRPNTFETSIR